MPRRRVSQTEIARRLGVSQRTVSKALRGESDISVKTREMVERTAREMSYHGDRLTRCLLGGNSKIIGLLLPSFGTPFLSQILDGAESVLGDSGYNALLSRWSRDSRSDEHEISWLLQYKVDGLVVFPRPEKPERRLFYKDLIENGQKIVFINEASPFKGASGVFSDDRKGMELVLEHMFELGHRRIAYCGPVEYVAGTTVERYSSYCSIMRGRGLEPMAFDSMRDLANLKSGNLEAFLDAHPGLSSFICFSDATAIELMQLILASGRRVPEDISVTGYGDDVYHQEFMRIPLTTVSQEAESIGRRAAKLCLEMIEAGAETRDINISTRLIKRSSTAIPPCGSGVGGMK